MSWRLYSRNTQGEEDVAFVATREEALVSARELLVNGSAISRIESDDGEMFEGKQLQEALATQHDRSKLH